MNHSSYVWRGLRDILITLPLWFALGMIGTGLLAAYYPIIAVPWGGGALFLCFCARKGARFAWNHQVDYVGEGMALRYRPVIIAFAYTLGIAVVASLLPVPKEGAAFGRFNSVFGWCHFFTSAPISIIYLFQTAPPWFHLAAPLSITTTYWLGMAYGYWSLGAARRDWINSGALAALFLLMGGWVAWRFVEIRRTVLPPDIQRSFRDRIELNAYRPGSVGNRLVKLTNPGLKIADEHPRIDGSTAVFPVYAAAAQAIYVISEKTSYTIDSVITSTKTGNAYQRLIKGQVDLIMVTPPSPAQRAAAEAAGVNLTLIPVAREAFVFFAHKDNPITGLTTEQIRAIYQKKIVNWSEVGGANKPIMPFQRPDGSGSQTAFLSQVMRGTSPAPPLVGERILGMGGIIRETASYRNSARALGYSFRFYLTTMDGEKDVKMLTVDGVEPTRESIRDGSYPLVSEIYLVTAGSDNPHVQSLIDWFLSPAGQALIEEVGYVGVKSSN